MLPISFTPKDTYGQRSWKDLHISSKIFKLHLIGYECIQNYTVFHYNVSIGVLLVVVRSSMDSSCWCGLLCCCCCYISPQHTLTQLYSLAIHHQGHNGNTITIKYFIRVSKIFSPVQEAVLVISLALLGGASARPQQITQAKNVSIK